MNIGDFLDKLLPMTDGVLVNLKNILESAYPGYKYIFTQGDGTEFGEPSHLSLDIDSIVLNNQEPMLALCEEELPVDIKGKCGNSWCFADCLGVNIYNIRTSLGNMSHVIDRALTKNGEGVIELLVGLSTRDKTSLYNTLLHNDSILYRKTRDLEDYLKSNCDSMLDFYGQLKILNKRRSQNNSVVFNCVKNFWCLYVNTYYILDVDNCYRARVLVFQFPRHKEALSNSSIIVQVREDLGTGKFTYHLGQRELSNGADPFIVSFPKEILCETINDVLDEVTKLINQNISNLKSIVKL